MTPDLMVCQEPVVIKVTQVKIVAFVPLEAQERKVIVEILDEEVILAFKATEDCLEREVTKEEEATMAYLDIQGFKANIQKFFQIILLK